MSEATTHLKQIVGYVDPGLKEELSRMKAANRRLSYDFLAPIMQGYADWIYAFKDETPIPLDSVPRSVPTISTTPMRIYQGGIR